MTNLCVKHVMSCHTELSENANHFNWEEKTTTRYPFQPKSNVLSTNLFHTEGHLLKIKTTWERQLSCETIQHLQSLKETWGTTVEHASVFNRGTLRFAVLKALAVTLPGGWGSSWKSELRPIERGDDFSRAPDFETLQVGFWKGIVIWFLCLLEKDPGWQNLDVVVSQSPKETKGNLIHCRLGQN